MAQPSPSSFPSPSLVPSTHLGVHLARIGYQKYGAELRELHQVLHDFCAVPKTACLSCTVELELSYMRLRETNPSVVWEISPASGFMTLTILHALSANGNNASLHSFDVLPHVRILEPQFRDLTRQWRFHHMDARKLVGPGGSLALPIPPPDYLCLDSKHTEIMGTFYISSLLPAVQRHGHVHVSLHDVYNPLFWTDRIKRDFQHHPRWMPNLEGAMVLDWLAFRADACRLFTPAPSKLGNQQNFAAIMEVREALGKLRPLDLVDRWKGSCPDSTVYFELNCTNQWPAPPAAAPAPSIGRIVTRPRAARVLRGSSR